eukprot:366089-Chlamydomonas_euryale.AAC.5
MTRPKQARLLCRCARAEHQPHGNRNLDGRRAAATIALSREAFLLYGLKSVTASAHRLVTQQATQPRSRRCSLLPPSPAQRGSTTLGEARRLPHSRALLQAPSSASVLHSTAPTAAAALRRTIADPRGVPGRLSYAQLALRPPSAVGAPSRSLAGTAPRTAPAQVHRGARVRASPRAAVRTAGSGPAALPAAPAPNGAYALKVSRTAK